MDAQIERWRKYLRKDPTSFLLDVDADPSVYLWYLLDIAHRPEDASVVLDARERVLYSRPVQELFAMQQPEGYWEPADSPAQPYYRATIWNLALLAELGIPRDSRRARSAAEYLLQNFLHSEGEFAALSPVESGYLLHALSYFRLAGDERVSTVARGLIKAAAKEGAADGERLLALWGVQGQPADGEIASAVECVRGALLDSLAERGQEDYGPITFPPFDPRDPLFTLRVLAEQDCVGDPRARTPVEYIIARQNELARWPLERSLSDQLLTRVEDESKGSRWATLNALRVIVKLVAAGA